MPDTTSPAARTKRPVQRADHVMGFSRDATTHHFHPPNDGGETIVTANDPNEAAGIEQIRTPLRLYRRHVLEQQFQCTDADS
jgi:hypothetical protein